MGVSDGSGEAANVAVGDDIEVGVSLGKVVSVGDEAEAQAVATHRMVNPNVPKDVCLLRLMRIVFYPQSIITLP
jgi:hypothetical protein